MAPGRAQGPRRMNGLTVVLLAALLALGLRAGLGTTLSAPVAWAIAIVVPVLAVLMLRKRLERGSGPVPARDEQQVDQERQQWAAHAGGTYDPQVRDVDIGLSRAVLLGNAVADSARQRLRAVHDGRQFDYQTWQVTRAKKPTRSRTSPMLMSTETHEVLILQTRLALPPVWLWGREYFRFQRWQNEFPLQGHGRYPLQVLNWTDAKGAALPEHWPVLEPVLGPFRQALQQSPVLLGVAGHQVSVVWQHDPTVATAQRRLQLANALATAMEEAVRAGQIPHGEPDPVGP